MHLLFAIMLFAAHYIGDFILQSSEIATTKSYNNKSLIIHGLTLSIPICVAFILIYSFEYIHMWIDIPLAVIIYTVLHMIQDRIIWKGLKKKVESGKLIANTPKFESVFFTLLGADQMLHMIVLFSITHLFII